MDLPSRSPQPLSSDPPLHAPPPASRLQRFFARLQQWADAGWSGSVVFGWGLLQGGIFPGVADLFFLPLSIANPKRAYRLALIATAGTVIGSTALYFAGATALTWIEGPVAEWIGITTQQIDNYRATLAKYGGWAIFASTMTPLSTKLTSIASGISGVPFPAYFVALTAGRLLRTMGLAWLVRHGGADVVKRWVGWKPTPSAPKV